MRISRVAEMIYEPSKNIYVPKDVLLYFTLFGINGN